MIDWRIHKFRLKIAQSFSVEAPAEHHFLSIGLDANMDTCMWLMVDPESRMRMLEFIMVGTGHNVPHVGDFVGTLNDAGYIWHYFTAPGCSLRRPENFAYITSARGRDIVSRG